LVARDPVATYIDIVEAFPDAVAVARNASAEPALSLSFTVAIAVLPIKVIGALVFKPVLTTAGVHTNIAMALINDRNNNRIGLRIRVERQTPFRKFTKSLLYKCSATI
jgi:cytochrome c1